MLNNKLKFYIFSLIIFFIDVLSLALFNNRIVQGIASIFFLSSTIGNIFNIATSALFLSLESFINYGIFGLDLGLILILYLLDKRISPILNNVLFKSLLLILSYEIGHSIIALVYFGHNPLCIYTIPRISVNILSTSIFLKFIYKGKLGNRLYQ